MSLLIKGIDMPNKIDLDFHDNHIVLGGVLYPIDIDQLVYIPTPHGRLIDGDKIMKDLEEWKLNPNNDDEAVVFVNHFQGIIRTEPTILDAEE